MTCLYHKLHRNYFIGTGIHCNILLALDSSLPVSTMLRDLPFTFAMNPDANGTNG
ncbi:hypothetical protein J0J22_08080 [Vibrio vulnificus]|nr:hypothetical protein [Vibrio vulnificus]